MRVAGFIPPSPLLSRNSLSLSDRGRNLWGLSPLQFQREEYRISADKKIACGHGTRFAQAMSFARPARVGRFQKALGSALFLFQGEGIVFDPVHFPPGKVSGTDHWPCLGCPLRRPIAAERKKAAPKSGPCQAQPTTFYGTHG